MELYLQNIVENLSFNNLPADWIGVDFNKFSKAKTLFDYQQDALKNALRALYLYYERYQENKADFYEHYRRNGLKEDLSYNTISESKIAKYFLEYKNDYPDIDNKIFFKNFINRMSFWMATGSGKTLVIVKLLELLGILIKNGKIPKKDILFLTYRDDLIEQFKKHVEEFNQSNENELVINLINLKEYSARKYNPTISFFESFDVYYYRSDLISNEQKDKIINYKNYDNNGNWYIILDEAHKGDKEDSKRQSFYSILSRNGFMFNFSATFTDPRDYATCVYNFNLEKFISKGYGKHIYISRENLSALENKSDEILQGEKQKILLKILILQSAINKNFEIVRQINPKLFHKPLLLTLVNSVNTEDSDLELFFREIAKIANSSASSDLLNIAKTELKNEFISRNAKYEFENTIDLGDNFLSEIENITAKDILKYVFNSNTSGKIEVLKIPSNKQELVFKLKTSDKPFALMKIGDITNWIREKLTGYEIIEKFDNESIFNQINNNEDINILMGSRAFYEGWDSNRPNIVLFINIGKGTDAKKFVLQSIGRGVRIEPLPNKRKRILCLHNNDEIDNTLLHSAKEHSNTLETLFIFGTKADNLQIVFDTLRQQSTEVKLGDLFEVNPEVKDKLLLIPEYTDSDKLIIEEENKIKYQIHPKDYEIIRDYFSNISDKLIVCKFDCNLTVLPEIKKGLNGEKDKFFIETEEKPFIGNPEIIIRNIFKHFSNKIKQYERLKELENEIIHFKEITISETRLNGLKEKIESVRNFSNKDKEIEKLMDKLENKEIDIKVYTSEIQRIEKNTSENVEISYNSGERLLIKHIANHYYIPILLSETEKIDFIKHIIKHRSEVNFIKDLALYLANENNFFKNFDWWFFSKIDETLDDIYIPYLNPNTNKMEKFKPDFIFWLKKEDFYLILFIDPKGIKHTDFLQKIDGYSRIFEEKSNVEKKPKVFNYRHGDKNLNVIVKLFIKPFKGRCPDNYSQYCFDNFGEIFEQIDKEILNKGEHLCTNN